MIRLFELENLHADIQAVHELVETLEAKIDGKEIVIKILKNSNGHYFYESSHSYRGADNGDPQVLEENVYDSIDEAAKGALRSAVMCYRSTDEGGTWMKNDSFIQ